MLEVNQLSKLIVDSLYGFVNDSLSKSINDKEFKSNIDQYLAKNIDKYSGEGPTEKPIFSTNDANKLIRIVGLTPEIIKDTLKKAKSVDNSWKNMNNPFNVAIVLALRYYILKKNEMQIKNAQYYLIVSIYPYMFYKYFKYQPNPSIMAYTISQMSKKYKLKQTGSLWITLTDIVQKAYELHAPRLKECDDREIILFINDVTTRLNSFMRKVANEFYEVQKEGKYLQSEKESFEEDKYYEADNNSYAIERITNNVVTSLVVNGPDMRIVDLSARNCKVSVNELRNFTQSMISDSHRDDIHDIIESILFLYLFSETEHHSPKEIGTNDFTLYCMKIYKKSNTTDKNIIRIKTILDKWLRDLGLFEKTSRTATANDYRKALFMFFVLTIVKMY